MHFEACRSKYLLSLTAAGHMLDVSSPPCGQQICTSLRYDWVAAGSKHTSTTWTALTLVTVAVAVFFNGGTRGYSHVSQKSAATYEKAIWEEFAYWHQAWRQKKAVRNETPNDGSSCTAAHHSKSFFLSLMNVTVLRYLMSPPHLLHQLASHRRFSFNYFF